jgi:hypothetical protein
MQHVDGHLESERGVGAAEPLLGVGGRQPQLEQREVKDCCISEKLEPIVGRLISSQ